MNTFSWLLKREYWEHRGGFFWTPFWITATILIFTLLGILWAEIHGSRMGVNIGVSLDSIAQMVASGQIENAGKALDVAYLSFAMVPCIALFFVLFFYLLGALYDDRRDRSVLFWKSLPVGDAATVLSKVVSAMLVAPLLALLVSTAAYALFLVLMSIWVSFHGVNPFTLLAASHPFSMFGRMLLTIPADAAWALPTIGWLLFWSAFVRSKPFLWAVILPVLAFIANSWMGALGLPNIDRSVMLNDVLARLLFGIVPGSWLSEGGFGWINRNASMLQNGVLLESLAPARVYALFGTARMWIGVVVGAVLIAAAIWLRGRRIETAA
ncbi:hypothetical protein [Dokdonella koreensis]|uniref:ABC transporter, permease protein n=1 Tax=Dokdonella koreensis DS-123 TaxID=1300342 RepID=A0A160DVG9_9GAMM|nr:hypothetical protein [Dokdonella koreensis]ANB18548.1 Putative ABC transporter, permease protein [Dokdonella koreensis DS-123]